MDTAPVTGATLTLEVRGKMQIRFELKRHLSPRTVGLILRALPVESNAQHLGSDIIYAETGVESGSERARSEFQEGDVAFLPMKGGVCFFMRDAKSPRGLVRIGKMLGDAKPLASIKRGDVMRIYADTG